MYVRLARFEGGDRAVMDRAIEEMRAQFRSGMSGEPTGEGAGQAATQLDRGQMETLRRTIKKVLLLADRDKGTSAMLVFTDTEDEIRRVDELFDRMSPGEGGGRRQSVYIYEVAIDEQSGA